MAYYLTIDKKGEQKILNISNSPKFTRISNLKENKSTIEEIDEFTTKFYSESDLKNHLYLNGIINIDDIDRNISIRMASKGKLEKVEYGLFYANDSKYLDDAYLRFNILGKQNDDVFLEKLCAHYRNSYVNNETIFYIRNLLETRKRHGNVEYVMKKMPKALDEFIINEIYQKDKMTNSLKVDPNTGVVKNNQKAKHDLAMFVLRYDKELRSYELGISEEERKKERTEALKALKESIKNANNNYIYDKPKKRIKRKEIEGQTSLFGD